MTRSDQPGCSKTPDIIEESKEEETEEVELMEEKIDEQMEEQADVTGRKINEKGKNSDGKEINADEQKDEEQYECIICEKKLDGKSIQCDRCDGWCHINCTMTKKVFNLLSEVDKNPNIVFKG